MNIICFIFNIDSICLNGLVYYKFSCLPVKNKAALFAVSCADRDSEDRVKSTVCYEHQTDQPDGAAGTRPAVGERNWYCATSPFLVATAWGGRDGGRG